MHGNRRAAGEHRRLLRSSRPRGPAPITGAAHAARCRLRAQGSARAAATSPPQGGAAVPRPTEAPLRPEPGAPLRRAAPPRGRRSQRPTAPPDGERCADPGFLLPRETAAHSSRPPLGRARRAAPPAPQPPALPVRRSVSPLTEGGAAGSPALTPRDGRRPSGPERRAQREAKRHRTARSCAAPPEGAEGRDGRSAQPCPLLRSQHLISEPPPVRPSGTAAADTNDGLC
eukprot:XP_025009237.1 atherin-like [Gallus gallus]